MSCINKNKPNPTWEQLKYCGCDSCKNRLKIKAQKVILDVFPSSNIYASWGKFNNEDEYRYYLVLERTRKEHDKINNKKY